MTTKVNITKRFKTERVKKAKFLTKSSVKWLNRQINDPFVLEAQKRGYRSRASFKILEINEKFKLFKKGDHILDLGSAPGGWSQILVDVVGDNNILAVDILEMEEIVGVKFIQQDFLAPEAKEIILEKMKGLKYNSVLSDMAANTTGDRQTDHIRTALLLESAFDFALGVLKVGGNFIGKIFQGGTEKELFEKMKYYFKTVKHFKPNSSRKDSVEMYVIAMDFKGL